MPNHRVIDSSVFLSYADLQGFFQHSPAIAEVCSRKDKPFTKVMDPLNPNLHLKWQVCQVASTPFRWILFIVLRITSKTARHLGATTLAKRARTFAQYQQAGFNLYSETPTKLFRIKNTINDPNSQGRILSRIAPFSTAIIGDPKVKARLIPEGTHIDFNHKNGICRGMIEWFMYLYLHTKDQFSDPRRHMAALGKQFANGGGVEPVLLHSLFLYKGKMLNIKIGTQPEHSSQSLTPLHKHTCAAWKSQEAQRISELKNLPPGLYKFGFPRHATAFVKINDNLGYFFDPNKGITEINGAEMSEKFYKVVLNTIRYLERTIGRDCSFHELRIHPCTRRN